MMTQTTLDGIFCTRLVAGATRTIEVHVCAAYYFICKEAETALKVWSQSQSRARPDAIAADSVI